jgi:hypothetical protein
MTQEEKRREIRFDFGKYKGSVRISPESISISLDGYGFDGEILHLDLDSSKGPAVGIFTKGSDESDGPQEVISSEPTRK